MMSVELTDIELTRPHDNLRVKFGKFNLSVPTIIDASRHYRAYIEQMDIGASKAPACKVFKGAALAATVSYNGRVWAPPDASPAKIPGVSEVMSLSQAAKDELARRGIPEGVELLLEDAGEQVIRGGDVL